MVSIFLCACWLFVYLLWNNVYSDPLPFFYLGCSYFYYCCRSSLCILDINTLSHISFANIFYYFVACLFMILFGLKYSSKRNYISYYSHFGMRTIWKKLDQCDLRLSSHSFGNSKLNPGALLTWNTCFSHIPREIYV